MSNERLVTARWFVAIWHFNGWNHLSLGLHVDPMLPNLEIHLPFGFARVGWVCCVRSRQIFDRLPQWGYEAIW
jgi:hypothetical protein